MATTGRDNRFLRCPHCKAIFPLAAVDRFKVEPGYEDSLVQPLRCRCCGHVFAPKDIDAVTVGDPLT
jgi:uncharacterized C2H2 Zn-finger protein